MDLTESITLGGRTAINRIAVAPMTNKQSSENGTLSEVEIEWLMKRARGGFGSVITGAWAIAPEGRVWSGQAALYTAEQAAPLGELGRQMATTPALGIVQLIHGGSRYTPDVAGPGGFSASEGSSWRGATESEIREVIDAHRRAALRVQAAGLAGIEVHAAHGFLPAQFLSFTDNRRQDGWGGGLEGRSRFVREVVRAIRDAVRDDFIIGVRLSPENPRHGIELHETAQVAAKLADDGADYLHFSLGDAFAMSEADPSRHPLSILRAALPECVRIVAAGKIRTPADATAVLGFGADIVAVGYAAIFDPSWPQAATDVNARPVQPPFTPAQFAEVGVSAPFVEYLREGWPEAVRDS
ncbi:NADH:flavin oxidoreductase [Microbacteriaceae bacterium VKM Ac-2855]|nr:NADH:flavin oxidoreductase [Microbacteriaceae bacterium VKM Ac-2855]